MLHQITNTLGLLFRIVIFLLLLPLIVLLGVILALDTRDAEIFDWDW